MPVNLQNIFDRTESLNFSKEVNYTRQQGIIGKATLSAGAENLKTYPLTIKLHHSFCNPSEVIKEIERKIADKEIIDYFQGSVYIGKYVIQNLKVEVLEQIDGYPTACIINVELLESGEKEENFVQQVINNSAEALEETNNTIAGRAKTFLASSNPVANFIKKQGQNIKDKMFDAAMDILEDGSIESLPEIGKLTAQDIVQGIISDIQTEGITKAGSITEKYTSDMNVPGLTEEQHERLVDALNKIPGKMVDTVLRG